MQRIHLDKWAKACALGAALLVTGCSDLEERELVSDELALRDQDQSVADEDDEYLEIDEDQPNVLVEIGPEDIVDHYIVHFKKGANPRAAAAAVKAKPRHVYQHVFNGFAGRLNKGQVRALSERTDVLSIEPDQLVTIDATQIMDGSGQPWNLDRIDQSSGILDKRYNYGATGKGVYVYVFDTGIALDHPDLPNVKPAFDAFGGNGDDCHGHGTHVAGIIGGKVHGVAKQAALRSVRVVGCNGSGTWSAVLAGIEWVKKNRQNPAVINLSVGGSKSTALNKALTDLAHSGVFVAVAAGNQGKDACSYSPASAAGVFAVAASDRYDKRASYSNYGSCVAAYAPGSSIRSAKPGGGTRITSGTSMAAPHFAGAAALYKSKFGNASSSKISSDLRAWASKNKIGNNPAKTPNLLLNVERL